MCVILYSNVVGEVFMAGKRPAPAHEFHSTITNRRVPLVAGGKLFLELTQNEKFKIWWQSATLSGKARKVDDAKVDELTQKIENEGGYLSNDPHVLALAQVSGARLLYTNDEDLQRDFKRLKPSGKIYTTHWKDKSGKLGDPNTLRNSHKKLLKRTDLCDSS